MPNEFDPQAELGRLLMAPQQGGASPPPPAFDPQAELANLGMGGQDARARAIVEASRPSLPNWTQYLPDAIRNPVEATLNTVVRVPLSTFDLPNLAARGIDWGVRQAANLSGMPNAQPPFRYQDYVTPAGTMLADEALRRIGVPPAEAQSPEGRAAQGLLGGAVGGATMAPIAGITPLRAGAYGLIGGGASETAGEVTRGTPYEIPARIVAGTVVPGGVALVESRLGAVPRTLASMIEGATPAQIARARELLANAQMRNQPLTVAEAAAEAGIPGAGRLLVAQRASEQTAQGAPTFDRFRQYQADAANQAINQAMDRVAPPVADPYAVGRQVQAGAQGVVDEARGVRTAAASPYYQAATGDTVAPNSMRVNFRPGATFDPESPTAARLNAYADRIEAARNGAQLDNIAKDLRTEINRLRAVDPGDATAHHLNEMLRTLNDQLIGNPAAGVPPISPNVAAGRAVYRAGSPAVERVEQGLPGAVAATADPQAQIGLLTGPNARPGIAGETARGIAAQSSPAAVADLVRIRIENAAAGANAYSGNLPRQQLGARFNVLMRTNPQAAQNFAAVLETVPGGQMTLRDMNDLMDIFQAQGRRLQIGSPTAFNEAFIRENSGAGPILTSIAAPTQIPNRIRQAMDRFGYGRNMGQVADILTSPTGLLDLQAAANRPSGILGGLLLNEVQRVAEANRRAQ